MKIYIVVACYGGLPEGVKPFLDEKEADEYGEELRRQKSFNEEDDTVAVYDEDLPLPASIQTRIEKHLADTSREAKDGKETV